MGLGSGLRRLKPVRVAAGALLGATALLLVLRGTATEPSATGAAAPLRDLTMLRPAPSSARMGLMARAILSSETRAALAATGLLGASVGGAAPSCTQTAALLSVTSTAATLHTASVWSKQLRVCVNVTSGQTSHQQMPAEDEHTHTHKLPYPVCLHTCLQSNCLHTHL